MLRLSLPIPYVVSPESVCRHPSSSSRMRRSAAPSQFQYQGRCIGPASLQRPFRTPLDGETARYRSKLPGHDDGNRKLACLGHDLNRLRSAVEESGERVRVQIKSGPQVRFCSNSSSMSFCIRVVSCGDGQFARAFEPELARASIAERSFSSTACVIVLAQGIPRALAVALALRKVGSGISSVVFMTPVSHIYGSRHSFGSTSRQGPVDFFEEASKDLGSPF